MGKIICHVRLSNLYFSHFSSFFNGAYLQLLLICNDSNVSTSIGISIFILNCDLITSPTCLSDVYFTLPLPSIHVEKVAFTFRNIEMSALMMKMSAVLVRMTPFILINWHHILSFSFSGPSSIAVLPPFKINHYLFLSFR